jgi:hypothetical protein
VFLHPLRRGYCLLGCMVECWNCYLAEEKYDLSEKTFNVSRRYKYDRWNRRCQVYVQVLGGCALVDNYEVWGRMCQHTIVNFAVVNTYCRGLHNHTAHVCLCTHNVAEQGTQYLVHHTFILKGNCRCLNQVADSQLSCTRVNPPAAE